MIQSLKTLNDLEVRWSRTFGKNLYNYLEIVQWIENKDKERFCFTLASWVQTKEGYELKFCGDRPFQYHNMQDFFNIAKFGQKLLDADFELEEYRGTTR